MQLVDSASGSSPVERKMQVVAPGTVKCDRRYSTPMQQITIMRHYFCSSHCSWVLWWSTSALHSRSDGCKWKKFTALFILWIFASTVEDSNRPIPACPSLLLARSTSTAQLLEHNPYFQNQVSFWLFGMRIKKWKKLVHRKRKRDIEIKI
jgi:hypothetical protein